MDNTYPALTPHNTSGDASTRKHKRFLYILGFLSIVFIGGFLAVSVIKTPLKLRSESPYSQYYYKGLLGVYLREPKTCGFLGCGPDPFPFMRDKLLWGVNASNMRLLGSLCVKDDNDSSCNSSGYIYTDEKNLIIWDYVIPDGDLSGLQLKDGFAVDRNNVYTSDGIYKVSDPLAFQPLICGFYRDSNHIYSKFGKQIQKEWRYFETEPIEADPGTFRILLSSVNEKCGENINVAEDKDHYYQANFVSGLTIIKKQ